MGVNDLTLAPTHRSHDAHGWMRETWPIHKRQTIGLVGAWVVLSAIWIGLGELLTHTLSNSGITRTDERVSRWFEARRTDRGDLLSQIGSHLAETWVKILVTAIICIVMMRMWRRWYEAAVVAVTLILEAITFVTITFVVGRPRPTVSRLDTSPVGSSFPSGHVAAAMAYGAIAVVVFWHTRNRIARTLAVLLTAIIPIIVGVSRIYRGMHYLSDVVAGALLGAVCVIVTLRIMRTSPETPPQASLESADA